MRTTYLLLIAGLTFACGKIDKTEVTQSPLPGSENISPVTYPQAMLVANEAELPPCTAANDRQLIYVKESSAFATCSALSWYKVAMPSSGGSSGISSAVFCIMQVSKADLTTFGLDTVPEGGLNFFYSITQYANNTRDVQTRISSSSFSYPSSVSWHAKQEGYGLSLSADTVLDVFGAKDFGAFYFLNDPTVTGDQNNPYTVVYDDPGLPQAKLLTFDAKADCSVNVY